jgi:hypothetical protein
MTRRHQCLEAAPERPDDEWHGCGVACLTSAWRHGTEIGFELLCAKQLRVRPWACTPVRHATLRSSVGHVRRFCGLRSKLQNFLPTLGHRRERGTIRRFQRQEDVRAGLHEERHVGQ